MILPGATIGILGGGQLGRMLALAALPLGYRVRVLDPQESCAAAPLADAAVTAAFDDADAAAGLAKACDVVTLEIEKIALTSLRAAAAHAPVRPGAEVLAIVQDRGAQKQWLDTLGLPQAPWRLARSPAELAQAAAALGSDCFVKSVSGGYDGRGQRRLASASDAEMAFAAVGRTTCVVEQRVPLACEVSVLVARRPGGDVRVYPPAFNHHAEQILVWSVLPAPIDATLAAKAQQLGLQIAEALQVQGLLTVEMFVSDTGELLVNELAPRPHNSYHASDGACLTGQFEQGIRAVCDLPLGATDIVRPVAIHNLLGDLWHGNRPPNFAAALGEAGVRLHLYGKGEARPGRKMGHLLASGATPEEATNAVKRAYTLLGT